MAQDKAPSFRPPDSLRDAIGSVVEQGNAASHSSFAERAVRHELRSVRQEALRSGWMDASVDPVLLQDIADIDAAFRWADAETARSFR